MENNQLQQMQKLESNEIEIEAMDDDDEGANVKWLINPGSFVTPDDLSQGEGVLVIDHLMEEIFNSLDTPTLLSCRLVSRRFKLLVEIPLQKLLRIEFINYEKQETSDCSIQLLSDLTSVLRTSGIGSSFPCRKFSFTDTVRKGKLALKKFLQVQGPHIDELSLSYSGYGCVGCDEDKQLARLCTRVFCHTPNLQSFSFRCDSYVNQFQESLLHKQVEKMAHLEKLKKLNIQGATLRIPSGILEVMTQLSPNLEEIVFGGDPNPLDRDHQIGFHQYLIRINRPFLVTKLVFDLFPNHISTIQSLVLKAESLKKPLKLREIFLFRNTHLEHDADHQNLHFDIKTVSIWLVNKILGSSSNSLETITLAWTDKVPLGGIEWPEILPKVTKFVLEFKFKQHAVDFNGEPVQGSRFFPPEFNFHGAFPSLQEVHFVLQGSPIDFEKFMDNMLGIGGEPLVVTMPTVKAVKFKGQMQQLDSDSLKRVQRLWPAAIISYSY